MKKPISAHLLLLPLAGIAAFSATALPLGLIEGPKAIQASAVAVSGVSFDLAEDPDERTINRLCWKQDMADVAFAKTGGGDQYSGAPSDHLYSVLFARNTLRISPKLGYELSSATLSFPDAAEANKMKGIYANLGNCSKTKVGDAAWRLDAADGYKPLTLTCTNDLCLTGISLAFADTINAVPVANYDATYAFVAKDYGYGSNEALGYINAASFKVHPSKYANDDNEPFYDNANKAMRIFAHNAISFEAAGGLKSITFTPNKNDVHTTGFTCATGTVEGLTWTAGGGYSTQAPLEFEGADNGAYRNFDSFTLTYSVSDIAHEPSLLEEKKSVMEWVASFNSAMAGEDGCSAPAETRAATWASLRNSALSLLSEKPNAALFLNNAIAQWSADPLQQAMKTYEVCVSSYGLDPFLSRGNSTTLSPASEESAMVLPIALLIGASALGILSYALIRFKARKEE